MRQHGLRGSPQADKGLPFAPRLDGRSPPHTMLICASELKPLA